MNFKEFLNLSEMPLRKAEKIGKGWDDPKSKHWWDDASLKLLQSEKGLEKIHNSWARTEHTYDFYFLKAKGMRDTLEKGKVDLNYVHETLGITDFQNDEDAITVIFTNNRGDQKVPMTSWIMAHRLGHALLASERFQQRGGLSRSLVDRIEHDMSSLLNRIYGFQTSNMYGMGDNYGQYARSQRMIKELMQGLGTMRSARQGKISRPGEFAHELVAQFLLTGAVKLNREFPRAIDKKMAWGNPTYSVYSKVRDDQGKESIANTINEMEQNYNWMIDEILDNAIGEIYVM